MNYKELGLKCGIEIHQQLEGKKLFCHCPTIIREDSAHFTIQRRLRAAAGESGKIDIAAQQEQMKDRLFHYQGYHDTTCLVELDCQPPHDINQEAVYTSLQLSSIVNASITPIVQVMRKTVVDGSNTSGFQRTALIARNGLVETSSGKVRIDTISLEEDSCKNIAETASEKTYRLDRLGIPLIEIGTAPDITTPEQCQETAKKMGLLLRSLPNVKRGLGTIRQDINVSIAGGTRIEIKGAQDLRQLPLLVELEAHRQQALVILQRELQKTKSPSVNGMITDLTSLFTKSLSAIITTTIKNHGKVCGIKLAGFAGYLGREIQPGRRFATECSDRAKIRAGVGGIFHSDELPSYGITDKEVADIKKQLKCSSNDAFVLVASSEEKAYRALEAVQERVAEAWKGVPKEVRKAHADGTTSFLRPMPGASRMYPETDVPLIFSAMYTIKLPELLEDKIKRYQKDYGLSQDLAVFIAKSDNMPLFEELLKSYPQIKPAFIAETLTSTLIEIRRKYNLDTDLLSADHFRELFSYLAEDKIHKDIVLDVLIDMIKGTFSLDRYVSLSTEDLHQKLKIIVEKNKTAPFPALMGMAMKELSGQASGRTIAQELQKILKVHH
ncbi:MAG: Glu-tRNA(Gln) amidotransferase subunit GatE [Nanoarchaeota archaeon]|nr:Glu-tRNA(Gln) amidotransferase subunit GatE [Nanoarchaeota archaeon]